MKNLLILIFVIIANTVGAQKFVLENDGKILENGKHVGKYEKTSDAITIIVNIDEDELINIEETTDDELQINYNVITFANANGSAAYLRQQKKNVNMVELMLRAKVLKGGVLQEEAVAQFCAKNTFENLSKKPLAKQQKDEIKTAKQEKKIEVDEDKEFEKDEKLVMKENKKEIAQEVRKEKKELAEEKRQEKKETIADKKEKYTPIKEIEPVEESSLVIDKGVITYRKKIIGKYTEIEGLIKNKKGTTMTIYNTDNKRVALVKMQYISDNADIIDSKTNTITSLKLYSNTMENKRIEIILQLVDMKIL